MQNRSTYYTLDESGNPVPNGDVWPGLSADERRVAKDMVDGQNVSTVFLTLDHQHGDGPPLLFETMVFEGEWDQYCWRYSTREQAQAGHDAVVAALRDGRDPNEAVSQ